MVGERGRGREERSEVMDPFNRNTKGDIQPGQTTKNSCAKFCLLTYHIQVRNNIVGFDTRMMVYHMLKDRGFCTQPR